MRHEAEKEKLDMQDERPPSRVPQLVAVLGAGTMGSAMARRLLGCGFTVHAWNRDPEPLAALARSGAETSTDACAAVRGADVVLTLLPTAGVVEDVMVGTGVLDAVAPDSVWAQMGTIGVDGTRRLAAAVRARRPDVLFVDAPVSGSRDPAEKGRLLVLASGPDQAEPVLGPVFDALGRSTIWLGAAGAGSQMKLVLNTWLAFQAEGAAESAALADQFSLRPADLVAALRGNPITSDYALAKLERMVTGDYRPDFSLDWALKDLDLVGAEAPGAAPVAGAIAVRWRRLVQEGWSGADVSAARNGLAPSATGGPGRRTPGRSRDAGRRREAV